MTRKIKIGTVLVLLVLLAIALVQNRGPIPVVLLDWSIRLPLVIVMLICTIVGFIAGVFFTSKQHKKK